MAQPTTPFNAPALQHSSTELDMTATQGKAIRIQDILNSELHLEGDCTLAPIRLPIGEEPSATRITPLRCLSTNTPGHPIRASLSSGSSALSFSTHLALPTANLTTGLSLEPQLARDSNSSMPLAHPGPPHGQQPAHYEDAGSQSSSVSCMVRASPQGVPPRATPKQSMGRAGGVLQAPQHFLMALPGGGAPLPVDVDYSQGSLGAQSKRELNAKAVKRHSRKKESVEEVQKQNRTLKLEIQSLKTQLAVCQQKNKAMEEDRALATTANAVGLRLAERSSPTLPCIHVEPQPTTRRPLCPCPLRDQPSDRWIQQIGGPEPIPTSGVTRRDGWVQSMTIEYKQGERRRLEEIELAKVDRRKLGVGID